MRISFIAANWSVPYATEVHLARELELLGHEVQRVDERYAVPTIERAAAEHASDLVLYMKCHGLPKNEAAEMWPRIEARGTKTASVHLDAYLGLDREREIGVDPMWWTQTVWTADGSEEMRERCARLGIDHRWFPPAIATEEAERVGLVRPELAHDVVFVGHTRYPHAKAWPWRGQLLDFLRGRYGDRFKTFDHGSGMRNQALSDLCASAKVVVGDSLVRPGTENYWSDRYFETVGRGGFLVAPEVPGIKAFLTDYMHLRYYDVGNTDRLGKIIDCYLEEPTWRADIAKRGRAHVLAHHTYSHRLRAMLADLRLA